MPYSLEKSHIQNFFFYFIANVSGISKLRNYKYMQFKKAKIVSLFLSEKIKKDKFKKLILLKMYMIIIAIIFLTSTVSSYELTFEKDPSLKKLPVEMVKDLMEQLKNVDKGDGSRLKTENVWRNNELEQLDRMLSSRLADAIFLYADEIAMFQNEISRKKIKNIYVHLYDPNFGELIQIANESRCAWSNQGNCPHNTQSRLRRDMFPWVRESAICNCVSCLTSVFESMERFKSNLTHCAQVFTYFPAMVKIDDEWRFVMEQVPTSCTCKFKYNLIINR